MKERFMKNGVFSLEYDKETLRDMVLILQEENKQLKKDIYDALKMIYINYGLLNKYQIEMLEDILKRHL